MEEKKYTITLSEEAFTSLFDDLCSSIIDFDMDISEAIKRGDSGLAEWEKNLSKTVLETYNAMLGYFSEYKIGGLDHFSYGVDGKIYLTDDFD